MNPFIEPDELQAILAIKPDAKFNIADNRNLRWYKYYLSGTTKIQQILHKNK